MILTNKGPVMPFKPVADSGCEPNIMTRAQAKASQLSYRPLREGELNIINIEGDDTSCFIGRTEPVSVVFGYGTAHEVSVYCKDGFLINGNPAADKMYSCVLGRSCLDKLSGFVVPVRQTFFYMPRIDKLDFSLSAMPVRLGRPLRSSNSSSNAASLIAADDTPPLFACAAMLQCAPSCSSTGQGIDEEDTTGQGGSSSSSQPVLHFCSSSPAADVLCSAPPPQQGCWEYVTNSRNSSSSSATTAEVSKTCGGLEQQPAADTHNDAQNSSTTA
jgi:hypothetical protein